MKCCAVTLSLLLCLCPACPAAPADNPLVVELWPGKPPDEPGDIGPETVRLSPRLTPQQVEVTEPTRLITNVTRPTLTVYRPTKAKDTGTAVSALYTGSEFNFTARIIRVVVEVGADQHPTAPVQPRDD